MLLMLLGSVNFVLHSEMWKGHVAVFFRDLEIRTMVLWLCRDDVRARSLAVSASPEFSDLPAMLRRGLFMVDLGVLHHGLPEHHHEPAHTARCRRAPSSCWPCSWPWAAAAGPRRAA